MNLRYFLTLLLVWLLISKESRAQSVLLPEEFSAAQLLFNSAPVKEGVSDEYFLYPAEKNGKYGFVHYKTGDTLIPFRYDSAGYFEGGLAPVRLGKKWGFINPFGKTMTHFVYDSTGDVIGGICIVKQNGKLGTVSVTGGTGIPCQFDDMIPDEGGLYWVKKGDNYGL